MEDNESLYVLPECNCVFTASGLDSYFNNQAKNGTCTFNLFIIFVMFIIL
jgi:hypothetical protein